MDVGVRAPVVLVGVGHVRVNVPGLRLADNLGADAVCLHVTGGVQLRHPVVDRLVHRQLGEQDPCAGRPQNVANGGPNVLGLDKLRRHLASPVGGLRVAQVEDVRIRRQCGQRPRQRRHEVGRRCGVILEDQQGPVGAPGALQAVLPGADVRGGAAPLSGAELELAHLVRVKVVPPLPFGADLLIHNVAPSVPGGRDLGLADRRLAAVRRREPGEGQAGAVCLQPRGAPLHAVGPAVQADHDGLETLQR
mmetsp:Transcript_76302/g.241289  ORF Transcript_76302/g.241289 Transcript_76302/m.241289 type:complete len:249 (+) Transcript_76302:234-980(+)